MNSRDISPYKEYVLRSRSEHGEYQRVRTIDDIGKGKWLVEWVEPKSSPTALVPSREILCLWSELRDYAEDERRERALREETNHGWPGEEHPLDKAVYEALEATGDNIELLKGVLSGPPDGLERVAARAGFMWPRSSISYTDRFGIRHYPWGIALELAKAFAAAEPNTVLMHIEVDERRWEIETREMGGSHILPMLEHYRAAWAIIRDWAGLDSERARLEAEIERLRELIDKAVWSLRTGNPQSERVANWLTRSVRGG